MATESKEPIKTDKITKETETFITWLTYDSSYNSWLPMYLDIAADAEKKARKRSEDLYDTLTDLSDIEGLNKDSYIEDYFAEEMSKQMREIVAEDLSRYPVSDSFELLLALMLQASLDEIDYEYVAREFRKTYIEQISEKLDNQQSPDSSSTKQ